MSFIRVFALIYGVSISGSTDLPTMSNVSTDLPTISPSTIRPTDLPTGSPSTISPSTIQPTALPTISPVTIICPQAEAEDERTFLSHFQIEEKKCINTPVEERVNLMKNILDQIADIPEPACGHLEIINVECGSYYAERGYGGYRRRRRMQSSALTFGDIIDKAEANINAFVGSTGTIMFEGQLLSFMLMSNEELNEELNDEIQLSDSSSDSSSDSFDGMDVQMQSGYNSINNMEQSENVIHVVNNVLIELNVWNYVLAFVVLEICIICYWYAKCKRY